MTNNVIQVISFKFSMRTFGYRLVVEFVKPYTLSAHLRTRNSFFPHQGEWIYVHLLSHGDEKTPEKNVAIIFFTMFYHVLQCFTMNLMIYF